MMFIKSGGGKDFSKKIVAKPFMKFIELMPSTIERLALSSTNPHENNVQIPKQYLKKAPKNYELSIQSSDIGIYISGLFVSQAMIGSVNIEINEFGDHVNRTDNINMLKEMYDGVIMGRMIQGEKEDDVRQNINNLPTNLIAYGTPVGIKRDKKKLESFKSVTQSGLYRRSYIYYEEPRPSKRKEVDIYDTKELEDLFYVMVKDTVHSKNKEDKIMTLEPEAQKLINIYEDTLLQEANENLYDDLIPLDETAYKTVEKAAAIISIINQEQDVSVESVHLAIELFKKTRASIGSLFEQIPVFELIYQKLSTSKEPLFQSDLIKKLGITKKDFDDNIKLVNEYAHRFNKKLSKTGSTIIKYWIEEFEINKLDKMILSSSMKKITKPEKAINFKSQEVHFFDNQMSIEALVTSPVQSFCLAHFEPSPTAPEGHRRMESFIQGQNMIAFDIDEGLSLDDALKLIDDYIYIVYTTKSHQKDKNGIICDRFRIILPTKTNYYVSAEQHKQLYENLSKVLNIPTYDVSTRNVSRLWFTNTEAKVFTKKEGDILDVRCCLPETETAEHILPRLEMLDEDQTDRRLYGALKWFLLNTSEGNRNAQLFRLGKFMFDLGYTPGEVESKLHEMNQQLHKPIGEGELRTLLSNMKGK